MKAYIEVQYTRIAPPSFFSSFFLQFKYSWLKCLADFIMIFPQLKCLDLHSDTRVEQHLFSALSQALELPCLQSLRLAGVDCLPEDLSRVFNSHQRSLQEISLDVIGISTSTGGSWQTLLSEIRSRLQLKRLQIMQCDTDGHDICFEEDDVDPSNIIDVVGEDPRLLDRLIEGISIRKWTSRCKDKTFVIDTI